mgnify:CR=1 FL=1
MNKKITGILELDAVIDALNNKHKDKYANGIISLGPGQQSVPRVPTGSMRLDCGIGGGVPVGRIVEVYGVESSGKTTCALNIVKSIQAHSETLWPGVKRYALIVDLEHSISGDFLKSIGVDMENLLWIKPNTAEEAFQSMMDLTKTGHISVMLLDSIDAAQSEAQLKKEIGENEMGGISKILSRTLREYSKVCDNTGTLAIFINQIRANPSPYSSPITTPGGNALKFYSSLRLQTLALKPSANTANAGEMRIKVIKNKVSCPKFDEIKFDIVYGQGPDPFADLMACAKNLGLIQFAGSSVKTKLTGKMEPLCSGGKAGLIAKLRAEPALFTQLAELCMTTASQFTVPVEEAEEEEPDEPAVVV